MNVGLVISWVKIASFHSAARRRLVDAAGREQALQELRQTRPLGQWRPADIEREINNPAAAARCLDQHRQALGCRYAPCR